MSRPKTIALSLPDGRSVHVRVRRHPRYRNLRLSIREDGSLQLSAPERIPAGQLGAFVRQHSSWIAARLPARKPVDRPDSIELRALGETWAVSYTTDVAKLTGTDGTLHLPAGEEPLLLLDSWLRLRAGAELGPLLQQLSAETGLAYRRLVIRNQRTRWGSYSSSGTVSLNCKLLFLPPELVHYVLLHELCHSVHLNHSAAYWTELSRHEPRSMELRRQIRNASRYVPDWMAGG